ncbi:MAG: tetratricopeptide repeat protein [Polyangiaceae bacterium]|nr:tetratricopeptide repeat protein [Polyangiaceae bacterium]
MHLEARILLCERCGAPLPVTNQGGATPCGYCGAVSVIGPSPFGPRLLPPLQAFALTDAQRAALQAQLASTDTNLTSLNCVPDGLGDLDGLDMSEAARERLHRAFLKALRACRRGDRAADQHRLYWVALRLANLHFFQNQHERAAPYLQQASETLLDPRFRRMLLLELVGVARRQGQPAQAEGWLAQIDEFPGDILLYSNHRDTRASFELDRGNPQGALALVGMTIGALPTADEYVPSSCLKRARALHRLGSPQLAEAALLAGVRWLQRFNETTNGGASQLSPEQLRTCERNAIFWFTNQCAPEAGEQGSELASLWGRIEPGLVGSAAHR